MTRTILVIGATGMLGFPVARTLNEAGFVVRVHSRDIYELKKMFDNEYEFHYCDVNDSDLLEYAFDGCYGVHINLCGGLNSENSNLVENEGVKKIVQAAKRKGVKKISLISGSFVNEKAAGNLDMNAKLQAEKHVKESGIDYTIFRSSVFWESLSYFIKNREAFLIGNLETKFRWIAAQDYADIVTQSFLFDDSSNKTFYVYGSEKLTLAEALCKFVNNIIPDVEIKKITSAEALSRENIFRKKDLLRMIKLFEYCEERGYLLENGLDAETRELFPTRMRSYDEWISQYTPPIFAYTPWKR